MAHPRLLSFWLAFEYFGIFINQFTIRYTTESPVEESKEAIDGFAYERQAGWLQWKKKGLDISPWLRPFGCFRELLLLLRLLCQGVLVATLVLVW